MKEAETEVFILVHVVRIWFDKLPFSSLKSVLEQNCVFFLCPHMQLGHFLFPRTAYFFTSRTIDPRT